MIELPHSPEELTMERLADDPDRSVFSRIYLDYVENKHPDESVPLLKFAYGSFYTWLMLNTWCIEHANVDRGSNEIFIRYRYKGIIGANKTVTVHHITPDISSQVQEIMDKIKAQDTK
tara:strand:+ start:1622 stop:1975 length:354 start_codon:yes stop_codon:yes gene_type:complete